MHNLLQYLLPNTCAICTQASEDGICQGCHADYFSAVVNRCQQCGIPLTENTLQKCGACLSEPPHFDATFASCNYSAPLDSLVLGLKFGRNLRYANLMAEQLSKTVQQSAQMTSIVPTVFCPVPLSRQRLIARGFNQSLEIARAISLTSGAILMPNLVWRLKNTLQQSSLHPNDRYSNVRGAFFVNPDCRSHIQGQDIAVIDDVLTTGMTLNEMAKILKQAGAASVTNFVFARTVWR